MVEFHLGGSVVAGAPTSSLNSIGGGGGVVCSLNSIGGSGV